MFSDISVYKFIQVFMTCFQEVTADIVVAALIYIERLLAAATEQAGDVAVLTESNGKGVLLVALTLAAKFHLERYEKKTLFFGVG